ncbi:MAG: hypothetical protein ABA06_00410 [Parcubacteria bacterium C7867-001]|nr:MAG: hypothetical protein ABA06_00410 [Parcubacteria bacterium C7867-001]
MAIFSKKRSLISGEIRYRPTLTSAKGGVELAKLLEGKFPHWRIRNGQDVALLDETKKWLIEIRYNSLIFQNEGEEAGTELIDLLELVFNEVKEHFGISDYLHVGCRNKSVYACSFQEKDLVDLTFRKLYGNTSVLTSMSGDKLRDTGFVLDATKGELNTHVQIGPAKEGQAENFINNQFDVEDLEGNSFLMVDVDVFKKTSLTKESCINVLKEAAAVNSEVTSGYIDFLSTK